MYYNLENDFANGCDVCEEVQEPQYNQPMMNQPPNMGDGGYTTGHVNNLPQVSPPVNNKPIQQQHVIQPPQQTPSNQSNQGNQSVNNTSAMDAALNYNNNPVQQAPNFDTNNLVESFTNNSNKKRKQGKMLLALLVIVSALAINECAKYYLNQLIQSRDGDNMYYLIYVFVVLSVAGLVSHIML